MAENSSIGYASYCSPIGAGIQQLPDRSPAHRVDKIGGNFGKRLEHEAAAGKAGVRYRQAGFPDDLAAIKEDVDIQRSRTF